CIPSKFPAARLVVLLGPPGIIFIQRPPRITEAATDTLLSQPETIDCVLLADRHHGLSEGVRNLLETTFKAVVMVADEVSLFESAKRLPVALAIVDLSLTREGTGLIRRLRNLCPKLNIVAISISDEIALSNAAFDAGANGFVLKRALATDLLP